SRLPLSRFPWSRAHRDLHSFPTRRSSDLSVLLQAPLIPTVARWLGVEVEGDQIPYYPSRVFLPEVSTESRVVELQVLPHSALPRSEEHTSELQSRENLVCRLLLEKKKD